MIKQFAVIPQKSFKGLFIFNTFIRSNFKTFGLLATALSPFNEHFWEIFLMYVKTTMKYNVTNIC